MYLEKKKPMRLRKSSLRVLNQIETRVVGGGTGTHDSFGFSCDGTFDTVPSTGDFTFGTQPSGVSADTITVHSCDGCGTENGGDTGGNTTGGGNGGGGDTGDPGQTVVGCLPPHSAFTICGTLTAFC